MQRAWLIATSALLGCSPNLPAPSKKVSPPTDAVTQKSNESVNVDPRKTYVKLLELKAQNDALCLRAQKQRVECPISNPLIAGESEKVLGCVAGVDAKQTVGVDFRISVETPPGYNVYLATADSAWQTNIVGTGDNQKLVWGPKKSTPCESFSGNLEEVGTQIRAPKILEVKGIYLKFVPHDRSKCDNSIKNMIGELGKLDVFVNGESLFNKNQLRFEDNAHQVALTAFDEKLNDPKCVIPKAEIDLILDRAIDNVEKLYGDEKIPATVSEDYTRETSRNQSLTLELTGNSKLGCWAHAKIEKFELKIEGSAIGNREVAGEAHNPRGEVGNSKGFTFNFGQGISHTISQEHGLFKTGGGFVTDAFADKTIQDLRLMSIRKLGVSFDSQEFRKSRCCGFLCLSTCHDTRYRIFETNRRSMSSLKILVNDQLVYENNGISFNFEDGRLKWPAGERDENIQDNPKFKELMLQTSCPAG